MKKPNFLILGAGKCGTTALHQYLGQHHDIFLSQPKETTYFDAEYEKGLDYYWHKYFADWNGEAVAGEARPINLFLPFVATRIRESLPDARLIVILRNPVDRAFSAWWFMRCNQNESLSFKKAVQANFANIHTSNFFEGEDGAGRWKSLISPLDLRTRSIRIYLECGYYAQQLKNYLALFPASQIKVVFFEDLRRDADAVVRELWDFLGVDTAAPLGPLLPVNVGVTRQMLPIVKLARRFGINDMVPKWMGSRVHYLTSVIGSKPRMDHATRRWLIEHYEPHVRELEDLLGRDLSDWRK